MTPGQIFYETMTHHVGWTPAVGPWALWENLTADLRQRYETTAERFVLMGWKPAFYLGEKA